MTETGQQDDVLNDDEQEKSEQEIENVSHETNVDEAPEETLDELSMLQMELKVAKEEAKQNYDQYLRVLAETDNQKKRMIKEREEYLKYANISLVKKLIRIMDDLERAWSLSQDNKDFEQLYKGVDMILKNMGEALEKEGVETIEVQGKEFDPEFHEPLIMEANDAFESNMIIEELQKGYTMHGRVVRPSLVKVCQ